MFSRENRRQQGAKSKYIFEMWVQIVQVSPALLGCIWRVHWCRYAGSLMLKTYTSAGVCPLVVCPLLLSVFPALLSVHCLQIWLYFAFLGRFSTPNRGGVSFVASSLYSNRHILTPASLGVLRHSIRTKGHRIRAKRGKSKHLFA